MNRLVRIAQVLRPTLLREGRGVTSRMSQNQKSITSFFSSKSSSSSSSPFSQLKSVQSKTPASKSPDVLKEKPPTKNSKTKSKSKSENSPKRMKMDDVETTVTVQVKKVRISEEQNREDPQSSPPSSPIKSGKRRRVQILESDESGSDTENMITSPAEKPRSPCTPSPAAPSPIPKRKTAKLSKEFRSKLKNRVQTPHVNKLKIQVPEEDSSPEESESSPQPVAARPSPVSSKLASFSYKKRAAAKTETPTPTDNSDTGTIVDDKPGTNKLNVNLKESMSPDKSPNSKNKSSSPSPSKKVLSPKKSPQKKSPVSLKKKTSASKPNTPKAKSPETKPKGKEKSKAAPSGAAKGGSLVSANSNDGYNPGKSNYVPSKDAIWKSGDAVPYKALSETLKAIEGTSGRLEKTMILSNFLRSVCILSPDDLHLCVYLCTNQVAPAYKGVELGVGETVVMKAVAEACGVNIKSQKAKMGTLGDLGLVAESSRTNQKMMFKPKPLTVKGVFDTFLQITAISGNQGQAQKISLIKKLLVSAQGSEARFITRSLLGKLRCGLADQTVLVSLGHATILTPPGGSEDCDVSSGKMTSAKDAAAEVVKTSFCEYPNFEHIIKMIREHGVMKSAEFCKLTPGVPVKPMLAQPTKGISEVLSKFEGAEFTCEFKYDGERAQIQCAESGDISIFSRNQENNTSKYPDIIGRIGTCLAEGTKSFMLDCEVVAWDVEKEQILPFQILTTRKRKDADIGEIKVKVCLFAFDLLYLNGESLIREPFRRRRELLHSAFKKVPGEFIFATARDCNDTEQIQEFLEESIKGQCEGLMVKTLDVDATYEIAKRSHNWLKVKKDYLEGCGDSLDLVVIGAFLGKGKRSGSYGGYLLACYDPDSEQYQAICKIGTGFTDEDLAAHHAALSEHITPQAKPYYSYPESSAPEVWFEPALVWEVKCADMTISPIYTAAVGLVDPDKGISLRFPRFIRVRDDKNAEDATSAEQVAELYNKQDNKQEQSRPKDNDDDY